MKAKVCFWSISCQGPGAGISSEKQPWILSPSSQTRIHGTCSLFLPKPRVSLPTLSNKPNQPKPTQCLVTYNGWNEEKWWIFPSNGTKSRSSVCSNLGHKHQLQLQDFGVEKMQNSFFQSAAQTLWFEARKAGSFGTLFLELGGLESSGFEIQLDTPCQSFPRLVPISIHPPSFFRQKRHFSIPTMQYCLSHFARLSLKPRIYRIL